MKQFHGRQKVWETIITTVIKTTDSQSIWIGVDIIEIDRIERAVHRWGQRFLRKIYTDGELDYCRGRIQSLAVRFAAKEAVMKALGTGRSDLGWCDVEVMNNGREAPEVNLRKRAKIQAKRIGATKFALSLSHSKQYAVAFVVASK